MAPPPAGRVDKPPSGPQKGGPKKGGHKNGHKKGPKKAPRQNNSYFYCAVCRRSHQSHEAHKHMHSMRHHKELEKLMAGRDSLHHCHACQVASTGLNAYAKHIATPQHNQKLRKLLSKDFKKPIPLDQIVKPDILAVVMERNRLRRTAKRKAIRKKKKRDKQEAALKIRQEKESRNTSQHPAQFPQGGSSDVLLQNKENRLAGRLGYPDGSRTQLHPGGWSSRDPHVQPPHVQTPHRPAHLQRDEPVWSDRPGFMRNPTHGPHGDVDYRPQRFDQRPWDGTDAAERPSPSNAYREEYYGANQDFTSDHLPAAGAIRFHARQEESKESSSRQDPGANLCSSSAPNAKPADRSSSDSGVIRDVDVNRMLREIRRSLGVREPCRADREARRLRAEAGALQGEAHGGTAQKEGPSSSSLGDQQCLAASPHASQAKVENVQDVSAKTLSPRPQEARATIPAPPKPRAAKKVRGKTPSSEASGSQAAAHQDPQSNGTERGPQSAQTPTLPSPQASPAGPKKKKRIKKERNPGYEEEGPEDAQERDPRGGSTAPRLGSLPLAASLSRHAGKTVSAEPNLNAARRVRNVEGDKEGDKARLKPTIQKLLCSGGLDRKVNWREAYQEAHRKKQEKVKGKPRFGIELANPSTEQEGLAQLDDADLPLSEGFQWECDFPFTEGERPPTPPCAQGPPAHTSAADDATAESQSGSRAQDAEQPGTTPADGRSSRSAAAVAVKMEAYFSQEDSSGCPRGNDSSGSNAKRKEKKRKADGEMVGVSNLDQSGKRKTKSKNDNNQVDQLLSVSLKEEELNQTLQDLDSSLIHSRNALQAAYNEVQRLLLLKQQFTIEVNNLRAKRIEILQGMKGGYAAGSSDSPVPMERPPSLNSSSPYAAPSILPPATPASIKQERYERYTEEVAGRAAIPPADAARQSPAGQDLPPRPASLPPAPPPPNPASPAISTASAPPFPESSRKRVKQEMFERMNDRGDLHLTGRESSGDGVVSPPVAPPVMAPEPTPEPAQGASVVIQDTDGEDVSDSDTDSSLKMVEPSGLDVIAIEDTESESDSSSSDDSAQRPVPPWEATGVEVTFAATQTLKVKVKEDRSESNIEVPSASTKNIKLQPDSSEEAEPASGPFQSHTGPVHGLQVHGGLLYTCSGDNTARAYSLESRELQAVFKGHSSKVNCLLVSSPANLPARLYTGSSDQTILCYSIKTNKCLEKISLPHRVLCLHIGWNIMYVGLTNGSVVSYDLKNLKELDVFECHGSRGVSCLATAQEGARRVLLVGSFDSTISVRDAKSGLLLRTLEGHTKTVLCMKVVNDLVFSGSTDTSVHAHNIHTGELVRIYKGHGQPVTAVAILGKVMVTACVDKLVRVYELQSHDRLQVYGGHSDMILCMTIHKSMIYTGCNDGSVQAVKLNLMRNHRCWWHGCTLIFGMVEHLQQHLLKDHSNAQQQTAKCRWRGCEAFFGTRDSIRLEMPDHMQHHAENDSRLES